MKFLMLLTVSIWFAKASAQDSQVYIDVGKAQVKKSLIALTPIKYVGTQSTNRTHIEIGQKLFQTVNNDLSVSGFFEFIAPEAYLEDPNKVGLRPAPGTPNGFNYTNWKSIGTEFLVRAAYHIVGTAMALEVYVYHVPSARQVMGKNYQGPTTAVKTMGHTFANDLIKALTGKKSMFSSKIVASRQEDKGKTVKEIYLMDWDGSNQQRITSHEYIAISPSWSTKGDKIAYTAYVFHKANKVQNPDLFTYDIKSGKRFLVSYRKGMNSGASFFPGDESLVLTLTFEGSPDLYKMSSDGKNLTKLTNGPNRAMNVESAVSPDGSKIAFSSDRSGRPMLYVMNADGTGAKRLTFAGRYNSTPAWSPDGKSLAFAALDENHFDIFTIGADGSNLKRLTDAKRANGKSANNESPSWSPDGRHVLFNSDRSGKYQLYIVNADGTNERRITNDNYNWDKPKW